MSDLANTLARNLAACMASSAVTRTQNALEEVSGVAQSTIGRLLRAEVECSLDTLEKIASALHVSAAELLTENGAESAETRPVEVGAMLNELVMVSRSLDRDALLRLIGRAEEMALRSALANARAK